MFEVSRVFQGSFKDVSKMFQGSLRVLTESFKGVSRKFQGRKFLGCSSKIEGHFK